MTRLETDNSCHVATASLLTSFPGFPAGSLDKFQFGTSAMVASDFDDFRGYRTLEYEGQVPTKPYNCCFSRVFQASVCIAIYTTIALARTGATNTYMGAGVPLRGSAARAALAILARSHGSVQSPGFTETL